MKTILTFMLAMAMCLTAQAQKDSIPDWQQPTKAVQKALQKAEKEEAYRRQMREKAMQKAQERKAKATASSSNKPQTSNLKPQHWFAGVDLGSGLAFGDDDDTMSDKFGYGSGFNVSGYAGYHFSDLLGARLKMRYLKQYNRCNLSYLERIAAQPEESQYFPRKGFYGYNTLAVQGELMLNLSKAFSATHHSPCNVYMLAGLGVNSMSSYDKVVDNWQPGAGVIGGGWSYAVDTDGHTMLLGVGGLLIDYRVAPHWSINVDLSGTITGDWMEGVKSEEWYDVYITYGLGITYHF